MSSPPSRFSSYSFVGHEQNSDGNGYPVAALPAFIIVRSNLPSQRERLLHNIAGPFWNVGIYCPFGKILPLDHFPH